MITDILIFGGQSNMQGRSECVPAPNEPVENAFEYRYLTDELIALKHPVGETIEGDLLLEADGGGTLVPDFCRTYVQQTGHRVVAIHAARGDTQLSQWLKGTDRYECARKKILRGIEQAKTLGPIGRFCYIWLQGESDAIYRTPEQEYCNMLIRYKNDLKQDLGIEKFGIIEIGYFCSTVDWLSHNPYKDMKACDETIMRAQEAMPSLDPDFLLLTQICKTLSLDAQYITPGADGHYNNKALTLIGQAAGKALSQL